MSITFEPAASVAEGVRDGEYDPLEVVESVLERIDERGDVTNAYVTVLHEDARRRAEEVRERVEAGDELPLAGVPVGVKDLSHTKAGVRYTMGMKPLADNVAEETSTVVERLEAAGAIVVGTTNTPELGHRVRTNNKLVGPTSTPFDPERNAGGSSGGSAAALADGLCTVATGSDVGGSLRIPAACCGVVSVKPTHGLVPRTNRVNGYRGHTPVGVLGPMARDVESLAIALDVTASADHCDPFSVPAPDDYRAAVAGPPDPSTLRLAYSPTLSFLAVEPEVREAVGATLSALRDAGATVEEVPLETPPKGDLTYAYTVAVTTYFATAVAEIDAALGGDLMEDHGEDLPTSLHSIVSMGESHDVSEYARVDLPRTRLYHAVREALEGYDALVCPTVATPPLTHDESLPTTIDGESASGLPTDWSLAWPFNMTGHPVVNVPAEPVGGLPIGMQLVGEPFSEARLLGVARAVEETCPWDYPGDVS